jgi:hypothetical protein
MANDSFSQQALAIDQKFRLRVQNALASVAWSVLSEDAGTPAHPERADYARTVINNLGSQAQTVAPWLVTRPNLMQAVTSYDFQALATVTDATDAALESQLMTDWNTLAGITVA